MKTSENIIVAALSIIGIVQLIGGIVELRWYTCMFGVILLLLCALMSGEKSEEDYE